MNIASQPIGPASLTTAIITCRQLSLMVCPFLAAYVTEGGWAGVLRNLISQGR